MKDQLKAAFLAGWDHSNRVPAGTDITAASAFEYWHAFLSKPESQLDLPEPAALVWPNDCNRLRQDANLPFPRTCKVCKLGPCHYGTKKQHAPEPQGRTIGEAEAMARSPGDAESTGGPRYGDAGGRKGS